jgi:hypothetical protein
MHGVLSCLSKLLAQGANLHVHEPNQANQAPFHKPATNMQANAQTQGAKQQDNQNPEIKSIGGKQNT